jgi:hypothetical protein
MGSRCLSVKNSEKEGTTTISNNNNIIINESNKKNELSQKDPQKRQILTISFFYFTIYKKKETKVLDPNIISYITCPICEQNIDDQKVLPRNLPCGHTLCNICIEDIKRKASEKYKCPFDRIEIDMALPTPVSAFLLEINSSSSVINKQKTFLSMKTEIKIRSVVFDSIRSILSNRKFKGSIIKKYLEFIASEIKNQIKKLDNYENYLNFSIVVFLFNKEIKFSSNGTCYNHFNDEIHFCEEYEDDQWKCVCFIYVYNATNLKLVQGTSFIENRDIELIQKNSLKEIEKLLNCGKKVDQILEDKDLIYNVCEKIKDKVLKDIKANYSFSVDCLLSNINAEEFGRFGGFFKKNDILRIPIKYKLSELNCLINVSCFKAI